MVLLRELLRRSFKAQLFILIEARTSVIFEPGNPPAATAQARARRGPIDVDEILEIDQRNVKPSIPMWLTSVASSAISSACDCLSIPTPTSTVTKVSTSTIVNVATTTVTVSRLFTQCLEFQYLEGLKLTNARRPPP